MIDQLKWWSRSHTQLPDDIIQSNKIHNMAMGHTNPDCQIGQPTEPNRIN